MVGGPWSTGWSGSTKLTYPRGKTCPRGRTFLKGRTLPTYGTRPTGWTGPTDRTNPSGRTGLYSWDCSYKLDQRRQSSLPLLYLWPTPLPAIASYLWASRVPLFCYPPTPPARSLAPLERIPWEVTWDWFIHNVETRISLCPHRPAHTHSMKVRSVLYM
jgi:hypothetical protein